jgi:hypothetical protein
MESIMSTTALSASGTMPKIRELSRLISAAVVNQKFCSLLLADPALALNTGYGGEAFRLPTEEQELILSIRATSLADFALQLAKNGNGHSRSNGNGNGHNGNGHNGYRNGTGRKVCGLE